MIFRKNRIKRTIPRKIGNSIIGFFVAIFLIFAVIFAFSQTSTFRNILRDKIVEIANNSLNGELSIGSVEGTLITHLLLKDITLQKKSDTLFSAKKIEFALNPFYILAKRIKVTTLNISDVYFEILETKKNHWNIENIVKADTSSTIVVIDSSIAKQSNDGGFPFLIDVSDFSLSNIDFKIKGNRYLDSHLQYETMNYDDIEIENFNLKLDLLANLNNKEFYVDISQLSFSPNLKMFTLHNFSGQISLSEKYAEVKNLEIITDSSRINLSARLEDFNLFGDINMKDFKDYPIRFNLDAQPFSMSDLTSFIESTNFMHGKPFVNFEGKGRYGNFDFTSAWKLETTSINIKGNLAKLHTPMHLYTKASFYNSDVSYKEVDSFLSGLDLPKYPNLFVENINIDYEGEPLKFNANGGATIGNGNFAIDAFMDITKELVEYNFVAETKNINLNSSLGINSILNTKGSLMGAGFDPEKSDSRLAFVITNSQIGGHQIDTANIKLHTIDQLIDLQIFSHLDSMQTEINGKLDLAITEKPLYNLKGKFRNLNLLYYTGDSTLSSSLNFTFDANGQSLDLDKTIGDFKMDFTNSVIGSNKFDSINFQIDLSKLDNTRLISLKSDILDFNITGDFLLDETFNLLSYQTKKLSYAVTQKLNEINPVKFSADSSNTLDILLRDRKYSQKDIYLDYDFNFKDFKLIAALLNRDKVEISGSGYGYVENDLDNFTVSTTLDLDWLFLFKGKEVFYISGVKSNFDVGADNNKYSFDNIFSTFSLNSEEMVSNLNINNIKADLIFNQSKAFLNVEANIDDEFDTGLEGYFGFSDSSEVLNISNLFFSYKDYSWQNRDSIFITNTKSKFDIKNFNLFNGNSKLSLDGSILNKSEQNFDLALTNVDGSIIADKFFDSQNAKSDINLNAKVRGTITKPIYNIDFSVKNFLIKNNYIGSLFGKINYNNKNINTNIEFLDSLNSEGKKFLTLVGNIPFNLDLENSISTDSTKDLALKLNTNNFNLASFGNLIPTIQNPQGIVNSEISVSGKLNDFNLAGYLSTENIKFTSSISNLDYITNFNLVFDKKNIKIENSFIKNNGKTQFPGKLTLSGGIILDGFSMNSANIIMNGKLAVLSPYSKATLQNFYGDLQLKSGTPWNYIYKNKKSSFSGSIILEELSLNFIPKSSSYSVSNSDFKYIFINDSTASELQQAKHARLLSAMLIKKESADSSTIPADFDLDIKIMSPNISKLSVVLSKALNQKLLADFTGELKIQNINNQFTSQGQFDILPSSMFTFYKTFSTEGSLKFTSDITNPIINITATYISDYINPRDDEAEPVKTAVKIKIDDSVNSLLTNMASGEKPLDMKVYSGAQNIDYNVPSSQYTNLDAMYFLLFGTFSKDSESANIAKSAGYSMLGSVATSFLNARLGNIVNNVNINQTGKETRYNVSGRVMEFRYTFGGSSEMVDWSQANGKIEYLFSPRFIMRIERKDPIISSSYNNTQKVNEFGVMYKFSF